MRTLTTSLLLLMLIVAAARATETENHGILVMPAPGKVAIDGSFADWDLGGGVFACRDVQTQRENYSLWMHAMHDPGNLYLLARWNDGTPLNNPGQTIADPGFQGDCLQVRMITAPGTPAERTSHWNCWRGRDQLDVLQVDYGKGFNEGRLNNAKTKGAHQAFRVDPDAKGYVQEIAIPWALLVAEGKPAPRPGEHFIMTIEPNFTIGSRGRLSVKDVFMPGVRLDREFTFMAHNAWGKATLEAKGSQKPRPVRLANTREFPVRLEKGLPVIDWTGLVKEANAGIRELKSIEFDTPADGYASLNILDKDGVVARQLLTAAFYTQGKHTVKWDGLTTPHWRTPGQPVPAGDYTWAAITHRGIGLRLRGWACNAGSAPWDSSPTTNWGGDMGPPVCCAADGDGVFLGWMTAEAGKGLVGCDINGNVRWRVQRGGWGGAQFVAVDAGVVYAIFPMDNTIYCVNAKNGDFLPWAGGDTTSVSIKALWGTDDPGMPDRAAGFDVRNGLAYLSCSKPVFLKTHVKDWFAFLGKIKAEGEAPAASLGKTVWEKIEPFFRDRIAKAAQSRQERWLAGEAFSFDDTRDVVCRILSELPRPKVEAAYTGIIVKARTDFVGIVDVKTGRLAKTIPVSSPTAIRVLSDTLAYVISGGTAVLSLNPQTGETRQLITGLANAAAVAAGPDGRIYVGVREPDHQVKVFDANGRPIAEIGRKGGRPLLGPWVPDGLFAISGLAVDSAGKLWVAEADEYPKRISVWDAARGTLLRELFGPTHYGASGGAINPLDPNVMVGEGCEWQLDPDTGRDRCTGVFARELINFALFCPVGGKLFLAANSRSAGIRILERLGPGRYQLRSTVRSDDKEDVTWFWADANGDAAEQPGEIAKLTRRLRLGGYIGLAANMNTDLTLTAGAEVKVKGFTACGAPVYDLANARALPDAGVPSRDSRMMLAFDEKLFKCYDVATGKLLWTYPNTFSGVHGSHTAPAAQPGLLRGAFSPVGSAVLPAPAGHIWAINSNVGEWHLLTAGGFYLSRIFQGDQMKVSWPEQAVPGAIMDNTPCGLGGEDFGGSMTQGADGKLYVQAGKVGLWNVEVVGLDTIRAIPGGTVSITEADARAAAAIRESYLQDAVGMLRITLPRLTPEFTGDLGGFKGCEAIKFRKQDDAGVRCAAAWDDRNLYLGWDVQDSSPWTNSAGEPAQLYLGGDTVDFQLAADPAADPKRAEAVAGDLRISIGNLKGKATAVIFRKLSETRKPMAFNSGVVKNYVMEYVDVIPATINVKIDPDRTYYVVQAAIPLETLSLKPAEGLALRGDFGVTHGDPAGQRTRLRTFWSNQHTGIVDDAVFELQMEPRNWGELIFK